MKAYAAIKWRCPHCHYILIEESVHRATPNGKQVFLYCDSMTCPEFKIKYFAPILEQELIPVVNPTLPLKFDEATPGWGVVKSSSDAGPYGPPYCASVDEPWEKT